VTLPLAAGMTRVHRMYEDAAARGEGFVAWGQGDRGTDGVVWTQPVRVELRTSADADLAGLDLRARSEFVPVAASPETGPGVHDWLIAGRSETATFGVRMWIEQRAQGDLAPVWGMYLDLESRVDHPEPRALERVGDQLVLAWAAYRNFGGSAPVPSCLYLTPLDGTGAPSGTTIRVDPGVGSAHLPGIEHVRVVAGTDGLYLLWRQDPELWVARIDWSS